VGDLQPGPLGPPKSGHDTLFRITIEPVVGEIELRLSHVKYSADALKQHCRDDFRYLHETY
jgi:hypothetical protein